MTPVRKAFATIAQLIEDARNLDRSGAPAKDVLSANLKRHEAEEIARTWAWKTDEETQDAA